MGDSLGRLVKFLEYITPFTEQLKWGEEVVVKCPDCGDSLTIGRSLHNGHVTAVCDHCGVKISE